MWNDCSNGNNYGSFDTDDNNPLFDETFSSYDDFCQDIENKLSSDWFGVGFDGSSSSGYADLHSYQVNGDLTIYYHDPYERLEVVVTNSFGSGTFLLEFQGQVNQYTAPDTFTFFHGHFIRLEAQNQQSGNYYRVFDDWEKDYVPQNSGISIEHTVTTDVGFEAVFKKRYDITFGNEFMNGGNGGDIIVDDTTWSAPKLKYVVEDNNVTAEAPTQDLDVNGKNITYNFLEWQDGNTSNPRTFTPNDHSNYTAIYKGHLVSNQSRATDYNNQRKIIHGEVSTNYIYMVYEDNDDIYFSQSANNGQTWSQEIMLSDGSGTNHSPSIARNNNGNIAICWEKYTANYIVFYTRISQDALYIDQWYPISSVFSTPKTSYSATPVIATLESTNLGNPGNANMWLVIWRNKSSNRIDYAHVDYRGYYLASGTVPNSSGSGNASNPAISDGWEYHVGGNKIYVAFNYYYYIRTMEYVWSGSSWNWGSKKDLYFASSSKPQAAVDGAGTHHFVWQAGYYSGNGIYILHRSVNPNTGVWSGTQFITTARGYRIPILQAILTMAAIHKKSTDQRCSGRPTSKKYMPFSMKTAPGIQALLNLKVIHVYPIQFPWSGRIKFPMS